MKVRQAFVLAGGKGERLRPLTHSIPKPLVKVNGKPILEYSVELLAENGVEEIILSIGYMHEKIEEFFGSGKKFGAGIKYAVEKEPLGTGGALKNAEEMLDEEFFMLNGDNIADFDLGGMAKQHLAGNASATLALVEVENVSGFGIAKIEGKKILEFVEKPRPENAPSKMANAGCYIIEKDCLEFLPKGFNMIEKTLFPKLAGKGMLEWFRHKGLWLTTDTFERLGKAEEEIRKRE